MEALKDLALSMLNMPLRYQQAHDRERKYHEHKAQEAGLTLDQYFKQLHSHKITEVVQECLFGENDDIVIFVDCWKAFFTGAPDVDVFRTRARQGYAHCHGFFEMFYVLDGYCYNYINGKEEVFHKGSVCMMNAQTVHERVIPTEDTLLLTMCIRNKVFDFYLLDILKNIPMFWQFYASSLANGEAPGAYMHLQDTPNEQLELILYQILRAYLLDDATSQPVMKCNLIPLFAELARTKNIEGFTPIIKMAPSPKQADIEKILENIRTHCDSITLLELSKMSNFSPNYLSALIKKHTGKTFQEIVSHYWKEKAATLLTCTPFGIDQIAELMGASSRSNFERRFKTLVGISPAQYRKNVS